MRDRKGGRGIVRHCSRWRMWRDFRFSCCIFICLASIALPMLFMLSLAVTVLGFAITGEELEQAMALAVAALSTTGPVAQIALAEPVSYADLSNGAEAVLCAAMVLGRLETLVIIALFNPEFWRK